MFLVQDSGANFGVGVPSALSLVLVELGLDMFYVLLVLIESASVLMAWRAVVATVARELLLTAVLIESNPFARETLMTTWHARFVIKRSQLGRSVSIALVLRIVTLVVAARSNSILVRVDALASNKRRQNTLLSVSS